MNLRAFSSRDDLDRALRGAVEGWLASAALPCVGIVGDLQTGMSLLEPSGAPIRIVSWPRSFGVDPSESILQPASETDLLEPLDLTLWLGGPFGDVPSWAVDARSRAVVAHGADLEAWAADPGKLEAAWFFVLEEDWCMTVDTPIQGELS